MTKSLSLDASLSNCGYCIGIDGKYQESGQFKPYGKDWIEKIQSISKWLYSLTMKHDFDVVFYEYPSGRNNHDTTIKLGALMYAVHLFCRLRDIEFVTVKPSEIKATGVYKVFDDRKKVVDHERLSMLSSFGYGFHYIRKIDGSMNQSAMNRQDDEIDSIGLMLAGWQKRSKDNG